MKLLIILVLICLPLHLCALATDSFQVSTVSIQGNTKTDVAIIRRELSFKPGDWITDWPQIVQENTQRLLNLFLFNEVRIVKLKDTVIIHLKERLYVWPKVDVSTADRNFNQWWLSKDFSRLNVNAQVGVYNIKGLNKTVWLKSQLGYTTALGIGCKLPYINAKQTIGFQAQFNYSANKEVWIQTQADKLQFYSANDQVQIKRLGAELALMHRPKIYAYHSLGFAFKSIQLADSALAHQGNNPYLWQGLSNQNEVNVSYQFNLDKRNFKGYPTKGYLIKGQLDNTTLFAEHSNLNYWQLKGSVSNYWPLGNRLFLAVAAMAKYSNNAFLPYNKFQSLGYGKDYIRGYELYVIDGHAFGLTKAEFKWQLLQKNYRFLPKVKHYEQLPVKVFWTIFNDWTYVRNERQFIQPNNNVLPNQYLYGIGTGINLLFYSDYCARIEYSQNKMGWDRLYLSFVTAF